MTTTIPQSDEVLAEFDLDLQFEHGEWQDFVPEMGATTPLPCNTITCQVSTCVSQCLTDCHLPNSVCFT